ncbi:MAG TPA: hypothetical protein VGR78_10445 [Verrucomicrobiae bacterium]|jgi:hypothetical protein|nr:hypothetical protein [Verrucomicrobiae bacterium]
MKPCSAKRKEIALLALRGLDAREEMDLRAHIESCAGCRQYLEEISAVSEKLGALDAGRDIQTSEAFHQKVTARVREHQTLPAWVGFMENLRLLFFNWRLALPAMALAGITIASLLVARPRHTIPATDLAEVHSSTPAPEPKSELAPSISNYQMIVNQSLDKLDDVLTRQAARKSPSAPLYTASSLLRADVTD